MLLYIDVFKKAEGLYGHPIQKVHRKLAPNNSIGWRNSKYWRNPHYMSKWWGFLLSFYKMMLTNAGLSCNIIQVAARHRPTWKKWDEAPWPEAAHEFHERQNLQNEKKKVLDRMKKLRYNKWVAWSERASKDKVVLWKLNNATWIICDSSQMFLKTSIDYEHKQSAISLLSFILKFRPKKIFRANQGSS